MDWEKFLASVLEKYQEDGVLTREKLEKFTQTGNPSTSPEIIASHVETHFDYVCQQKGLDGLESLTIPEIIELYKESYESNPDIVKGELKHHGWVGDTYSLEISVNSGVWSTLDGVYSFQPDVVINDSPTYKHENEDLILWKFDLPKKKGKTKKYVWMISKEEHVHTQNAYACCRDNNQDPRLITHSPWLVWDSNLSKFREDDAFRIEDQWGWECL
jgi:hypothetical protein